MLSVFATYQITQLYNCFLQKLLTEETETWQINSMNQAQVFFSYSASLVGCWMWFAAVGALVIPLAFSGCWETVVLCSVRFTKPWHVMAVALVETLAPVALGWVLHSTPLLYSNFHKPDSSYTEDLLVFFVFLQFYKNQIQRFLYRVGSACLPVR